jgi:hypothetical protein
MPPWLINCSLRGRYRQRDLAKEERKAKTSQFRKCKDMIDTIPERSKFLQRPEAHWEEAKSYYFIIFQTSFAGKGVGIRDSGSKHHRR